MISSAASASGLHASETGKQKTFETHALDAFPSCQWEAIAGLLECVAKRRIAVAAYVTIDSYPAIAHCWASARRRTANKAQGFAGCYYREHGC